MSKRFTRNIRLVKNIEKQPKYTNEQNDLLSDDKHVYIRNKNEYHNLTNNVKSVNDKTIDENGNVEIDTGTMTVNEEKPDKKGNVTIDTGAMTVNEEKPDKKGNVTIDTGTMTVNEEKPDDSGNVEIDTGAMQVNGKHPDEEGHILLEVSDLPNEKNLARIGYVKKEISNLKKTFNNYKVLLYEGSASNTGDVIPLNQPYTDFTELKVKINRTGGSEILNFDAEDDSTLPINFTNIYNDNSGMKLYEMNIARNSSTELEITGQRTHTVNSDNTSQDSGVKILKIWGVK